ncbi:hypothetical protein KSP40_PGU013236 [Platanthera guangdongensis]|uniref:Uncharacterized protein n=1 Tax=Platanthera guangdongensis TaxID=2320717 RepID=A0ABR2MVM0_9ASPA
MGDDDDDWQEEARRETMRSIRSAARAWSRHLDCALVPAASETYSCGASSCVLFQRLNPRRTPPRTLAPPLLFHVARLQCLRSAPVFFWTPDHVGDVLVRRFRGFLVSIYSALFPKFVLSLLKCSGLKEYFAATPSLALDSPSAVEHSTVFSVASTSSLELEDSEINDEFHDAIAFDGSLADEDSDSDDEELPVAGKVKLKNISWAIASLALKKGSGYLYNIKLLIILCKLTIYRGCFSYYGMKEKP